MVLHLSERDVAVTNWLSYVFFYVFLRTGLLQSLFPSQVLEGCSTTCQ